VSLFADLFSAWRLGSFLSSRVFTVGAIEAKAADWSMQVANEIKGRLQELAAKIAAEKDHDRFMAVYGAR
jgi:hypothetical protein